MDELKRTSDFEALIRIDENVKSIKKTLDEYPPSVLSERIQDSKDKIDGHIKGHTAFWFSVVVPVGVAIMVVFLGR